MSRLVAVAVKDLRSELRGKEVAPAMIIFALVLVFLLTFVLPPGAGRAPMPRPAAGAVASREIAPAFLWAGLLFAAVLGFARNAAGEREGARMEALALSPVDPAVLFFGKALANFIYLVVLEAVVLPFFVLLVDLPPGRLFPEVVAVALVADVGLAAAGTLLAAASQYARAREVVLPLIALPVMLPVVLAATRLTAALATTGHLSGESRWFILMLAFDAIFLALAAVTYGYVINE